MPVDENAAKKWIINVVKLQVNASYFIQKEEQTLQYYLANNDLWYKVIFQYFNNPAFQSFMLHKDQKLSNPEKHFLGVFTTTPTISGSNLQVSVGINTTSL